MNNENQKTFHRSAVLERESVTDEEKRVIEVAFASEEALVPRNDVAYVGPHYERLGHGEGEIDTSFIGSGRAPLLLDHNKSEQIGVVESVEVRDGVARARVRLSRSARATEIWNDIVDGIRSNVSVGYFIKERKVEGEKDGIKVQRAVRWVPFEVSLVSVPADTGVGVGRSLEPEAETEITTTEQGVSKVTDEVKREATPEIDLEAVKREAAKSEQARVREISNLGSKYGMAAQADEFIKNNKPAEEFRAYVLDNMDLTAKETKVEATREAGIGMSEKEVNDFSLVRALRAFTHPNESKFQKDASFEIEVSRAAAAASGKDGGNLVIPYDVLVGKRNLTSVAADNGAKLVGTDHLGGSFIDFLYNRVAVMNLGAQMLSGLRGNVSIPRLSKTAIAGWITPEGTASSNQDANTEFDNVTLSPKTLGANVGYTRTLLLQSDPSVDGIVASMLATKLGLAIDQAVLYGAGASGAPTGIVTALSAESEYAGPYPTWEEVVSLETAVAAANADVGNLAYITNAVVRGGLKVTPFIAGRTEEPATGNFVSFSPVGGFVWQPNNTVNGYQAVVSNQVQDGDIFYGNWADVLIGMWGGLELIVDPYTGATSGNVRVTALQAIDIALRHDESFAYLSKE